MSTTTKNNPRSFVARVLTSWPDFRSATKREIDRNPSESSILAYIMGAFLALFLIDLPSNLSRVSGQGPDQIAMSFAAYLLFCPLLFYGIAVLVRLLGLAFGGEASWKVARIATVWAFWMAMPLLLVRAALSPFIESLFGQWGFLVEFALFGLPFLWIWAAAISAAHGFRSTRMTAVMIFAILVLVPMLFSLLGRMM